MEQIARAYALQLLLRWPQLGEEGGTPAFLPHFQMITVPEILMLCSSMYSKITANYFQD
jgi:hypothetical protein